MFYVKRIFVYFFLILIYQTIYNTAFLLPLHEDDDEDYSDEEDTDDTNEESKFWCILCMAVCPAYLAIKNLFVSKLKPFNIGELFWNWYGLVNEFFKWAFKMFFRFVYRPTTFTESFIGYVIYSLIIKRVNILNDYLCTVLKDLATSTWQHIKVVTCKKIERKLSAKKKKILVPKWPRQKKWKASRNNKRKTKHPSHK